MSPHDTETTTATITPKSTSIEDNTDDPDEGPDETKIYITAGVVVVLLLLVGFIAFCLIIRFVRRRKQRDVQVNIPNVAEEGLADPIEIPLQDVKSRYPPIACKELIPKYMLKRDDDNRMLTEEFQNLPEFSNEPTVHSEVEYNKEKNKFPGWLRTFDNTRVKLNPIPGKPGSDYIHANYVSSNYGRQKTFIAAQAPMANTVEDFWRMVWEQKSTMIVMLTNLVMADYERCYQYYPDPSDSQTYAECSTTYGPFTVHLEDRIKRADYVIRTFLLSKHGESLREIKHFHYTSWQETSIPKSVTSWLAFSRRVSQYLLKHDDGGPPIIHCCGGVGEAAIYIVVDAMVDMLNTQNQVDIFGYITDIRGQRHLMVPFLEMYLFIYRSLVEWHAFGVTEIPIRQLKQHVEYLSQGSSAGVTGMELEFKKLAAIDVKLLDEETSEKSRHKGASQTNANKNRYDFIIPFECNRVIISPLRNRPDTDYINASWIDDFLKKKAYVITQDPLAVTVGDFWRMIWEHESTCVVMLTEVGEGQAKCHRYWPTLGQSETYDTITISCEQDGEDEYPGNYTLRTFCLKHSENEVSRTVYQFHYHGWPDGGQPEHASGLIDMISQIREKQDGASGPVTIHCSGGGDRSSSFCAISQCLDSIKNENVVDVFQTARCLREQRQYMIPTVGEYAFVYKAILEYIMSNFLEVLSESESD